MTVQPEQEIDTKKRRPKDRKEQIAQNASRLFVDRGFHVVRMEDIAVASGITVRALYRHYAHKQALLSHVVNEQQQQYLHALSKSGITSDEPLTSSLEDTIKSLTSAALDTPDLTVLWQREARYLSVGDKSDVAHRLTSMISNVTAKIESEVSTLSTEAAEIRAAAVFAILASPGHHAVAISRPELEWLMHATCLAAVRTPAVASLEPCPRDKPRGIDSRRESLMASAAQAFRRSGYPAVGIDDIGRELGIVGPALYRYFTSKIDVLINLSRRYDEWLNLEAVRAIRTGGGAHAVLRNLVAGYVRVAVSDPDLTAMSVTETHYLPQEVAEQLKRSRQDRDAEWHRCVAEISPNLSDSQTRVVVAAAMGMINDTVRIRHILERRGIAEELVEMSCSIMTTAARDNR